MNNKPEITSEHIKQINKLIADNPKWDRTTLSKELCVAWGWKSPTGQIKDIAARDLLRSLDKKGHIRLPAAKRRPRAPGVGADKIATGLTHGAVAFDGALNTISPIQIKIATSAADVGLFKSYMHRYHYLGFDRSIGEGMKYFVCGKDGGVISCLMFGSAAWSCRARDEYIGWDAAQRRQNLPLVTNNSRFLILPDVHVPHLASHILGAVSRRIPADWQNKYGHPVLLLETFVEANRFRGTCYKAANWRHVGSTSGLGRNSTAKSRALPVKDIWLYPLCDGFNAKLCVADGGAGYG